MPHSVRLSDDDRDVLARLCLEWGLKVDSAVSHRRMVSALVALAKSGAIDDALKAELKN